MWVFEVGQTTGSLFYTQRAAFLKHALELLPIVSSLEHNFPVSVVFQFDFVEAVELRKQTGSFENSFLTVGQSLRFEREMNSGVTISFRVYVSG